MKALFAGVALLLAACSMPGANAPAATAALGEVDAGKFTLRYRMEGKGRTVLVLGETKGHPRTFSAKLRDHLRLAFLEHRAFARSSGALLPSDYEFQAILDDIERMRRDLALGCVAVAGHSGNALIALEYAKKHPAWVSHIVMVAISPNLGPANADIARRYWIETASAERKAILEDNYRRLPDEAIDQMPAAEQFAARYRRDTPRIWFDPGFDPTPLLEGFQHNGPVFTHVWGSVLRDLDITRGLSALRQPVFLALGRHDFGAPPSTWEGIGPKFADLTIRVFESSGHFPHHEEPERFDRELLQWLEKRPGACARE